LFPAAAAEPEEILAYAEIGAPLAATLLDICQALDATSNLRPAYETNTNP
jgi:hypothetical protein